VFLETIGDLDIGTDVEVDQRNAKWNSLTG
jgi:hypothetical protein